jgi:cold shock protein
MSSTGTIKKFMEDKGFGFITPDNGSGDVFFHIRHCKGVTRLEVGMAVTYDTEQDDSKGKMQAKNCRVVGGGGVDAYTYRHRMYRNVTEAGVGKTRTNIKPVLPAGHPLVLKRKADNAAQRAAKSTRQKTQ